VEPSVSPPGSKEPTERLLRLFATARAIHRELLQLPDEPGLLARACEIAVDVAGFRFAWVGQLDAESGSIRPIARWGAGDGYLEEVAIVLDGSERGRGPTGSAIREGRHVVCEDIAADQRMLPWREAALRRGFRASGAFPIARAGAPFGALNVYSAEPGFGEPREVELLSGIAEDIGIALDFIDREKLRSESDRRLRESESRYRALVDQARDGIFVAGADLRYVDVNPAACAMLGYERNELLGKTILDVIEPASLETHPLRLDQLKTGESVYAERRLVRKDGSVIDVEVHGVRTTDGRYLSVTRDISERKRLHVEQAATERMVSLGRLAQGIGHEINNPLAFVALNLELARSRLEPCERTGGGFPGEVVTALDAAHEGVERIAHVVRALSAFGRGDSETLGPVDVSSVIDGGLTLAANRLRHLSKVERDVQPGLVVHANEFRLGQVLVNLLMNAADAMEELPDRQHLLRVSSHAEDPARVVIAVADSGPGLPEGARNRVFEPLYTTKRAGRGTGIGLSISQAIVASFGGVIEAGDSEQGGALFRIVLRASTEAPPSRARSPVKTTRRGRLRVLVVDDEPMVGRVIQQALAQHEVTVVDTVREAIETIESRELDCILCDLMLPDGGGEVLHRYLVEKRPEYARRVAFMTGGAFTPSARAFFEGVDAPRLEKPFGADALSEMVEKLGFPNGADDSRPNDATGSEA
jgi:PAS domain S-box-containing protein